MSTFCPPPLETVDPLLCLALLKAGSIFSSVHFHSSPAHSEPHGFFWFFSASGNQYSMIMVCVWLLKQLLRVACLPSKWSSTNEYCSYFYSCTIQSVSDCSHVLLPLQVLLFWYTILVDKRLFRKCSIWSKRNCLNQVQIIIYFLHVGS